jgi:hypothetical protein
MTSGCGTGGYWPQPGIFYFRPEKQQKAAALEPTKKVASIVLGAILATLTACRQRAGFGEGKMSTEHFEPYGELLPEFRPGRRKPPTASAVLSAVGQSIFWSLVVVIVFARIAYFSPAPSFSTHVLPTLMDDARR